MIRHVDPQAERMLAQLVEDMLNKEEAKYFAAIRKGPPERDCMMLCGKLQMIEHIRGALPEMVKRLGDPEEDDNA